MQGVRWPLPWNPGAPLHIYLALYFRSDRWNQTSKIFNLRSLFLWESSGRVGVLPKSQQTNKTLDSGSCLELNSNFGSIRILFWTELIFFKNNGGKSYFLHELSNNLKWSNLLRSFLQHQTANFKWTNSQHTLIMLSGHMFSFCNHQNRIQ